MKVIMTCLIMLLSLAMIFTLCPAAEVNVSPEKPAESVSSKAAALTLIMTSYKGPTVTISGEISFSGNLAAAYIRIIAKTYPGEGDADINFTDIPIPGSGKYFLKVPRNIGKVYIAAAALGSDRKGPSKKSISQRYLMNPIEVKANDIAGIDIVMPSGK